MALSLNPSTRNKAVVSALFLTFIYFIFHQIAVLDYLTTMEYGFLVFPLVISFFMALGVFWVLNFSVKGERIITIIGFAVLNVFILSLFLEFLILTQGIVGQITTLLSSLIFVFGINYLIILTGNIHNVAHESDIPLGQAGRAASYIFSLIVLLIAFFILFSNDFTILLRLGAIFFVTFYFTYSLLWTLKINFDERLVSSLGIAFATMLFGLVLNLWPVPSIVASFIMVLVLYVSLGIALEMKEKISKYVWVEYGVLFMGIFLVLIAISSWGINGHLF